MLRVRDTMAIEGPDGKTLATVKKAIITPIRDRWTIKIKGGPKFDVQGNILGHEYTTEQSWHRITGLSRQWFRLGDTSSVQIATDGPLEARFRHSTVQASCLNRLDELCRLR